MSEVKVGEHYRHFKGHEYEILHLAVDVDDLEPMVVYQNLDQQEDARVWVRKLSEFTDLHPSGVKRFELIKH